MNKMMVAVFDSESAAFDGLSALKELHRSGDISLYSTAVVTKDTAGKLAVKQAADQGPLGTGLGMLTGSLVGLLAGPAGVAVGASLGALTGLLFDLNKSGTDVGFIDEVSKSITPGKAAVLADVDEGWTTPVNTRLEQKGGLVFRRLRSEVVEDQLAREAAAFAAERKELRDELAQSSADAKAALQKDLDTVKNKLQATGHQAKTTLDHAKSEMDARILALEAQVKGASDRQKAKIESASQRQGRTSNHVAASSGKPQPWSRMRFRAERAWSLRCPRRWARRLGPWRPWCYAFTQPLPVVAAEAEAPPAIAQPLPRHQPHTDPAVPTLQLLRAAPAKSPAARHALARWRSCRPRRLPRPSKLKALRPGCTRSRHDRPCASRRRRLTEGQDAPHERRQRARRAPAAVEVWRTPAGAARSPRRGGVPPADRWSG